MTYKYDVLIFLLLFPFVGYTQIVHDRDLQWTFFETCRASDQTDVYAKVDTDPVILASSLEEFEKTVSNLQESLNFNSGESGALKLKLGFLIGQRLCVRAVGFKGVQLNEAQTDLIRTAFSQVKDFLPGKQQGQPQNCEGIILFIIVSGKVDGYRLINFDLQDR